jgi:type I restriction-modification system DNA methylase subunit
MALFQSSVLKKYLSAQEHAPMRAAFGAYQTYFHDPMRRANIRASKEEQFQEGFLRELFVNILGYTINPDPDYNLTTELKNIKDSKKTDGAILKDGKALAVIELKGTDTKDLEKIRDQAFNYKNNQPDCVYVITSNFEKLRFYIHNAVDYVEFSVLHMQQEEFRLMWLLLQKDNLLKGIPQQIKAESLLVEEQVTKKLYSDYSSFKQQLWQDMVAQNPGLDELLLYKKSQKLLDRFLFIFFAEDKGLLPPNSISEIIKQWETLEQLDSYVPLYDRFKLYFGFMNAGRPAKKDKAEIHAYNGGLFAPDPLLDSLKISDALLKTHVSKLTEYDFESEVDTNILGHIFEHSLNDIENVRASLEGTAVDKSKTKRKKDGVFYTPKYITKYIVDNTVGKLCTEKKAELGMVDEEFNKYNSYKTKEAEKKRKTELKQKLDTYRNWLLQLTVCDPACGSGAFLNQVLEFLIAEHRYVDELEAQLFDSPLILPNVENHILENNIFGVDINEESVEIARLSLWLRTAQKGRKLSTLSSNIKVGNSLIDDPEVAGDLAFNWQAQFPKVFAKGGFDVVVGNPPYGAFHDIFAKSYIEKEYKTVEGRPDLYEVFIERTVYLLGPNGILSFIIPNTILTNLYSYKLRKLLLEEFSIREITNFGLDVFADPTVHTCIISVANSSERSSVRIKKQVNSIDDLYNEFDYSINQVSFTKEGGNTFDIFFDPQSQKILTKMELQKSLGDICFIRQCIKTGDDQIYVKKFSELPEFPWVKTLQGKGMGRYQLLETNLFLKYGNWLARNWKNKSFYETPKIGIRETGNRITATIDIENRYFLSSLYSIYPKSKFEIKYLNYLLGIINSNIATYYIKKVAFESTKGAFTKVRTNQLARLPIPNGSNERQELISDFVIKILELNKEFIRKRQTTLDFLVSKFINLEPSSKLQNWPSLDFKGFLGELSKAKVKLSLAEEAEWMVYFNEQKAKAQALQSDITRLDLEIDALVYELYGLTEEEIRIVEGE